MISIFCQVQIYNIELYLDITTRYNINNINIKQIKINKKKKKGIIKIGKKRKLIAHSRVIS